MFLIAIRFLIKLSCNYLCKEFQQSKVWICHQTRTQYEHAQKLWTDFLFKQMACKYIPENQK